MKRTSVPDIPPTIAALGGWKHTDAAVCKLSRNAHGRAPPLLCSGLVASGGRAEAPEAGELLMVARACSS